MSGFVKTKGIRICTTLIFVVILTLTSIYSMTVQENNPSAIIPHGLTDNQVNDTESIEPNRNFVKKFVPTETNHYADNIACSELQDYGSVINPGNCMEDDESYTTLFEEEWSWFYRDFVNTWCPSGWTYSGFQVVAPGHSGENLMQLNNLFDILNEYSGHVTSPAYDLTNCPEFEFLCNVGRIWLEPSDLRIQFYAKYGEGNYGWETVFDAEDGSPLGNDFYRIDQIFTNPQFMHSQFKVKYLAQGIGVLELASVDFHCLKVNEYKLRVYAAFSDIPYGLYRNTYLCIDLNETSCENLIVAPYHEPNEYPNTYVPVGTIRTQGLTVFNVTQFIPVRVGGVSTFRVRFTDEYESYPDAGLSTWKIERLYLLFEDYIPQDAGIPTSDSLYGGNILCADKSPHTDNYAHITTYHFDEDGFEEIQECHIVAYADSLLWHIRWTPYSTNIESGSDIIQVGPTYIQNASGYLNLTWSIRILWEHPDVENISLRVLTMDEYNLCNETHYIGWNIETRLTITGNINDSIGTSFRGAMGGQIVCNGTLTYYNSQVAPSSDSVDVWMYSNYNSTLMSWSDSDVETGHWQITIEARNTVANSTYNFKAVIQGCNVSAYNLCTENVSINYITDCIRVESYSVVDSRVNVGENAMLDVLLVYEYDETHVEDGTVSINGIAAEYLYDGIWRVSHLVSHVSSLHFDAVQCESNIHGINAVNQNNQSHLQIWDKIEIIEFGSDESVSINQEITVWCRAILVYDNTSLDAGDTIIIDSEVAIWNGTHFIISRIYSTPGPRLFYVNSSYQSGFNISTSYSMLGSLTFVNEPPNSSVITEPVTGSPTTLDSPLTEVIPIIIATVASTIIVVLALRSYILRKRRI